MITITATNITGQINIPQVTTFATIEAAQAKLDIIAGRAAKFGETVTRTEVGMELSENGVVDFTYVITVA